MASNLRLIGTRLKEYLQLRGLTISSVTRMTDFSSQELDAIIEGTEYPIARLEQLFDTFQDLNPRWLLHGEAPMLLIGTPRTKREPSEFVGAPDRLRPRPAPADPDAREQVLDLQEQIAALRATVEELSDRLARLEARN